MQCKAVVQVYYNHAHSPCLLVNRVDDCLTKDSPEVVGAESILVDMADTD